MTKQVVAAGTVTFTPAAPCVLEYSNSDGDVIRRPFPNEFLALKETEAILKGEYGITSVWLTRSDFTVTSYSGFTQDGTSLLGRSYGDEVRPEDVGHQTPSGLCLCLNGEHDSDFILG